MIRSRALWLSFGALIMALMSAPSASASASAPDPASLVDPLIGTDGNGHTFPGASVPFGMVQFSPISVAAGPGGYRYTDPRLTGFGLTRLSGAGCTNYGDVPIMPTPQAPRSSPAIDPSALTASFSHRDEQATPGFYQVRFDSGISVALTTTTRTGLGAFAYPRAAESGTLVINPSGSANAKFATVQIVGRSRLIGSATSAAFSGACGHPPGNYTVYFALEFQRPFVRFGTWSGARLMHGGRTQAGNHVGAYVVFDTRSGERVRVKAAVSFVSIGNALTNLAAEARTWDLRAVASRAHAAWDRLLQRIQVNGGTLAERRIFYTALYHALLHPSVFSDANGQYIGEDGQLHTDQSHEQYTDFSGWDIYRGEMQLLALIAPRQASDVIQSLIEDGQEIGQLPKWLVANAETGLMVGDPSDAIIADAYAFGARNFDTGLALHEMLVGAGLAVTGQQTGKAQGYVERPALAAYLDHGYIPGAASTTLEYATADFAISELAAALGDQTDAAALLARSGNWKQLFNPQTGFIEPRLANGSFPPSYDPTSTTGFVEGDGTQYTWTVPQDIGDLLTAIGYQAARQRLDSFFSRLNAGPSAPHAWLGNEPSLLSPFAYLWLGVPWRSEDVIHTALTTLFTATPNGLPGNDDLGALSSWYVWSALGLYPAIPGVAGLAIVKPLFPRERITLANGAILTIATHTTTRGRYIRSLTLNHRAYDASWLPLSEIGAGARLDFILGATPSTWATSATSAPPSFRAPTP